MAIDFPANPTNGQTFGNYIYDSSIPGWRNVNSGEGVGLQFKSGLVPMIPTSVNVATGSASVDATGGVTFTGVTAVSLNNVFTSGYRNYRLVMEVPTVSSTASTFIRLRSGGTDSSVNTYYQWWFLSRLSGSTQTNTGGPNTYYSLMNMPGGSGFYSWVGEIMTPQIADKQTTFSGLGFGQDATNSYQVMSGIVYNTAASFDGFTLQTFSGATLTGFMKIYGYN